MRSIVKPRRGSERPTSSEHPEKGAEGSKEKKDPARYRGTGTSETKEELYTSDGITYEDTRGT